MKKIKDWQTVATHGGFFHADDVLAVTILKFLKPDIKIIRTRDPRKLAAADLRIDIGGKFRPSTGDYDHHQASGAGVRSNGVPYAAAGLVWREFGKRVVRKLRSDLKPRQINLVFRMIDEVLIQPVDAYDTGIRYRSVPRPYVLSDLVRSFNPTWDDEGQNFSQAFAVVRRLCQKILKNEIQLAASIVCADSFIKDAYESGGHDSVLVLNRYLHWNVWQAVVSNLGLTKVLFVITPTSNGWLVTAQVAETGTFTYRKLLPEAWAGLTGRKLVEVTGLSDARFCHTGRWICGAATKEGALELARLALAAE